MLRRQHLQSRLELAWRHLIPVDLISPFFKLLPMFCRVYFVPPQQSFTASRTTIIEKQKQKQQQKKSNQSWDNEIEGSFPCCWRGPRGRSALLGELARWARYSTSTRANNLTITFYFLTCNSCLFFLLLFYRFSGVSSQLVSRSISLLRILLTL